MSDPWWGRAACSGMPLETFFPRRVPRVGHDYRPARRICMSRPVREQCLTDAMGHERGVSHHRAGMWGGLTPDERAQLAREG